MEQGTTAIPKLVILCGYLGFAYPQIERAGFSYVPKLFLNTITVGDE